MNYIVQTLPNQEDEETNIKIVTRKHMKPKLIFFDMPRCAHCVLMRDIWNKLQNNQYMRDNIEMEIIYFSITNRVPEMYSFVRFAPFILLEAGLNENNNYITPVGIILGRDTISSDQNIINNVEKYIKNNLMFV